MSDSFSLDSEPDEAAEAEERRRAEAVERAAEQERQFQAELQEALREQQWSRQVWCYHRMALLCWGQGRNEDAILNARLGLLAARFDHTDQLEWIALDSLVRTLLLSGASEEALKHADRLATEAAKAPVDDARLGKALLRRGEARLQLRDRESAAVDLTEAEERLGSVPGQETVSAELAECRQALDQIDAPELEANLPLTAEALSTFERMSEALRARTTDPGQAPDQGT